MHVLKVFTRAKINFESKSLFSPPNHVHWASSNFISYIGQTGRWPDQYLDKDTQAIHFPLIAVLKNVYTRNLISDLQSSDLCHHSPLFIY